MKCHLGVPSDKETSNFHRFTQTFPYERAENHEIHFLAPSLALPMRGFGFLDPSGIPEDR